MLCSLNSAPDGAVHLRAHVVHAFLRIGNPEPQLELDAVVAEVHQPRYRRRIAQHAPLAFACVQQDLQRELRIVAVAHPDRQLQPDPRIGVAPVDHRVGDQLLVRHQHLDAVAVAHDHIAAAQFLHPAEILRAGAALTGKADHIARLDGTIHEQHEAADEIGGDRLQAETQPQAYRAGEHRQGGEIDARRIQADENAEADQKRVREFGDADARRGGEGVQLLQPSVDPAADPCRHQHEQRQGEQQLQHRPHGDARLAGGNADAVENVDDGIEPAQVVGGDREPEGEREPILRGFASTTCCRGWRRTAGRRPVSRCTRRPGAWRRRES